jgi:hypothetical protein
MRAYPLQLPRITSKLLILHPPHMERNPAEVKLRGWSARMSAFRGETEKHLLAGHLPPLTLAV